MKVFLPAKVITLYFSWQVAMPASADAVRRRSRSSSSRCDGRDKREARARSKQKRSDAEAEECLGKSNKVSNLIASLFFHDVVIQEYRTRNTNCHAAGFACSRSRTDDRRPNEPLGRPPPPRGVSPLALHLTCSQKTMQ